MIVLQEYLDFKELILMRTFQYNPPVVEVLDTGYLRLVEDWDIRWGFMGVTIPAGFVTDGNSVPRPLVGTVPKFGKNTLAGLLHDWLYASQCITQMTNLDSHPITQEYADDIRLELCAWCGVPMIQRYISYYALRVFGRFAWDNYKKKLK